MSDGMLPRLSATMILRASAVRRPGRDALLGRNALLGRRALPGPTARLRRLAALVGVNALLWIGALPAQATKTPSAELSFHVALSPDSITVGDPITLVLEAGGPSGAKLGLPQLADSIGPFSVLAAQAPATALKEGRLSVHQEAKVTLFKTGDATFPELELIWERAPGETLVAYSQPQVIKVRAVLQGNADLSKLRGLKGVVPLGKPRYWLWGGLAALVLLLAFLAWRYRGWLRRTKLLPVIPPPPPLPPEVAFDRGLAALYRRELPEKGLVKEFYAELSLLFRRYLEDRFLFPAVEETRTEILCSADRVRDLTEADRHELADWLAEGDLVKFAKLERLLAEARGSAERARAFVLKTAAPKPAVVAESAAAPTAVAVPSPLTPLPTTASPVPIAKTEEGRP